MARAETTQCTPITYLPITISSQGVYCLTGNLATSITTGNAIDIQTNNVTIDLNGYKLGGLGAGTGTETNGIYAYQKKNITIKNGIVRGFFRGIDLEDDTPYTTSQGHLIEDIRADQNTKYGIVAKGRGNTLRRNQVVDTGGSSTAATLFVYGIYLAGPGGRVLDNDIIGVTSTGNGSANGIYMTTADGSVSKWNRISDIIPDAGVSNGLVIFTSNDVMASGNRIANAGNGIIYVTISTGKYMNNLTSGTTTPFSGGTAVGINN